MAVAAALLLLGGGFTAFRVINEGKVLGRVTVGGVPLGGLTPEQAAEALAIRQEELAMTPFTFLVNGAETKATPAQVGFELDVEGLVEEAMALGRTGDVSDQFLWWLADLLNPVELPLRGSVEPNAARLLLEEWSRTYVGNPPFPGGLKVEGTTPVPLYPRAGEQIDPVAGPRIMLEVFLGERSNPARLPVVTQAPPLTDRDIDAAVTRARLWLSAPITLAAAEADVELTFGVTDLARALVAQVVGEELRLSFDPQVVGEVLQRNRNVLEMPPVDARFEIDGYQVVVVPGRPGTLIDPEATAQALASAAGTSSRRGVLPFRRGVEPEVTKQELEALGIRHLVSSFTTFHPCCQNRVQNIHRIADAVDGAIVMPGETFGLNAFVGPRTAEQGYLPDGTIIGGELVATVGGGVSQFATTFYNAVFWGGYEDVRHKTHSFYFSRYPEGIEATISWPEPELEFRNDSDTAILIKTEYTDTSITVNFYGFNDGRIVVGSHRDGRTTIQVVDEGGPNARRVSASVSERFNFTEPTVEYRPNPDLAPDEQHRVQSPSPGWTVKVTRTITQGDETRVNEWTVRYIPKREIIEVHPCMMPDATEPCPTTTSGPTTTAQPATTAP